MSVERIISADSHVSIPGELFDQFLPARYRDERTPNLIGSSLSSRQKAQLGAQLASGPLGRIADAMRLAAHEGRPLGRVGGFDPKERLVDMDTDGVYAEVLYGLLGGFYQHKDLEERRARTRAYNDALWEWCSADRRRLIPVGEIPIEPVELGVEEIRRVARLGYRTGMIPLYPEQLGLARYWDPVYDPLFAAAAEHAFPLSLHVGENAWTAHLREVDPTPQMRIFMSIPPLAMAETLGDLLLTDVCDRHPDFQFVLVESGIGWIAYYLERLDTMHRRHGWWKVSRELPSARWYRQGHATFEEDQLGVMARARLGVDNILWATDYPHPDSTWPESRQVVAEHFAQVPPDEARRMAAGNAARLYRLDD
jgi:predicted TIM-barrel fold metal-dependent hydrolase